MNMAIAFFSGCMTFVLVMVIKIPLKRMNRWVVVHFFEENDEPELLCKRFNVSIMVVAMLLSMLSYCIIGGMIFEMSNLKWCCAMKGGAIAIALHAIYAQWCEIS